MNIVISNIKFKDSTRLMYFSDLCDWEENEADYKDVVLNDKFEYHIDDPYDHKNVFKPIIKLINDYIEEIYTLTAKHYDCQPIDIYDIYCDVIISDFNDEFWKYYNINGKYSFIYNNPFPSKLIRQ